MQRPRPKWQQTPKWHWRYWFGWRMRKWGSAGVYHPDYQAEYEYRTFKQHARAILEDLADDKTKREIQDERASKARTA